ncbi:MAG: carboxypeptidase-like regulatory domain-containing protein [Paludibacter sp.]|nr:carboxypeptidase-like regulatory domain-containing protein [Paludibacter sp.]
MKTLIKYKKHRLFILFIIIINTGSFFAKANTTLIGRITDKNGNPIPYATATVIDPETRQITEGDMADLNGNFIIEKLKPGKYILSLRNVGYETNETRTIVIGKNDINIHLYNMVLNESIIQLSELNVLPDSNS